MRDDGMKPMSYPHAQSGMSGHCRYGPACIFIQVGTLSALAKVRADLAIGTAGRSCW
jgi:hypothetical protein